MNDVQSTNARALNTGCGVNQHNDSQRIILLFFSHELVFVGVKPTHQVNCKNKKTKIINKGQRHTGYNATWINMKQTNTHNQTIRWPWCVGVDDLFTAMAKIRLIKLSCIDKTNEIRKTEIEMWCVYIYLLVAMCMYYVRMFVYVSGVKVWVYNAQWLEIGVCVVLAVCGCGVR